MSDAFTRSFSSWRRVQTRRGDTVQAIASRELGDATRWRDIVSLNDLRAPFITDDDAAAGPHVLLSGAEILIPAAPPASTAATGNDDPLGIDLALPEDGHLQIEDGDFLLVSGTDNLRQAVGIRIATEPGELIFHPRYGCDVHRLKGAPADDATNQLGAFLVGQALRQEARLARVSNVIAEISGDTLAITATATAVDGRRITIGP